MGERVAPRHSGHLDLHPSCACREKQTNKGRSWGKFTLQDFDHWSERIEREKFEYLFRSNLRVIASVYIDFLRKIASPLFVLLQRDFAMVPGFQAVAALKYNPYPDPRYRIVFDDVFWHLDKQSIEETFNRLLERPTFGILRGFLPAYFQSKSDALAAVCENTSFDAMLERTGARLLRPGGVVEEQLMCRTSAMCGTAFGPVKFEVYQGRKVRFSEESETKFKRLRSFQELPF